MSSECSIICYFKTKNNKFLERGTAPPLPYPLGTSILMPLALAPVQNSRSATGFCDDVGCSTNVGSVSWKTTWRDTVTVTSAVAAAVAWAGSQPGRPWSPWSPVSQAPKSMALPIVDLAEMEDGQSVIGLLIIDSSCTLQSFSRRLAYSLVSHHTPILPLPVENPQRHQCASKSDVLATWHV